VSDTPTKSDYPLEPPGPDRPTWQKVVSRDVRELKASAEALLAGFESAYGKDSSGKSGFAQALWRVVRERGALRVFELTFARAVRTPKVDDFEKRLEQSIADLEGGQSKSPSSVPTEFAYYLIEAVEQAVVEKEKGALPDYETPDVLLRLGTELLGHRDLAPWRSGGGDTSGEEQRGACDLVGRILGRHQLKRRLGKGGFAEVFEAEHLDLHVVRAVKILSNVPRSGPARGKAHEGLLREARTQVALDHPNVVRLLDVGDQDGLLYLVMDYVEGRTLAELIGEKSAKGEHFTPIEILDLSIAIAEALRYAHSRQIVHRDLKPENILIGSDGRVKIGDFGLARRLVESGQQQVSRNGYLIGTPQYMAPEQVGGKGNTYDHRADLYSLGVVLYHMAIGVVPFDDEDVWAILRMHREEEPVHLSDQRDGFPLPLEEVILRCLRKEPGERFADATELLASLRSCRDKLAGGEPEKAKLPKERRGRSGLRVAAGVLLLVGLGALGYFGGRTPGSSELAGERGNPAPSPTTPVEETTPSRRDAALEAGLPAAGLIPEKAAPPRVGEPEKAAPDPDSRPEPSFREKIAKHAVTPSEVAAIGDFLDLVSSRWTDLRARAFDPFLGDLERLESLHVAGALGSGVPDERRYLVHHFRAAREMVEAARGAVRVRLEELARSREPISLLLSDGTRVEGTCESLNGEVLTLVHPTKGRNVVQVASIATESLIGEGAPAAAALALGALSGRSTRTLAEIIEATSTQETLVLWLPLASRLARHEIEAAARSAAQDLKASLLPGSPAKPHPGPLDRVLELAGAYQAREGGFLQLYPYLGSDFGLVKREAESLRLLGKAELFQVLARGVGTASYPAAAEVVYARFIRDLEAEPLELLTGTGWFGYGWKLLPPIQDLKERLKSWEVDSESDTSTLRAAGIERRIVMGEGVPDARSGVLLKLRFQPEGEASAGAEWSFLLRTRTGAESRLRANRSEIGLYRTVLEPGGKDVPVRSAPLPKARERESWRTLAILPGGGQLHVFVDQELVMSVPEAEATIPVQMQFSAFRAKVVIGSVRIRKLSQGSNDNR
jgi:serine/threonine protein kinase